MHSTALMYLLGAAILNTLCSDDVTYPDDAVPLHVEEWSIRIPKNDVTFSWHLTFYLKHFAIGFYSKNSIFVYSNHTEHGRFLTCRPI